MIYMYHPYVNLMYLYVIRISLVSTGMSFAGHSYVLVCHRMSLVYTRMSSVCHLSVVLPWTDLYTFRRIKKKVKFQIRKEMTNSRVTKIRFHSIKIAVLIKLRFHDVFIEKSLWWWKKKLFTEERLMMKEINVDEKKL